MTMTLPRYLTIPYYPLDSYQTLSLRTIRNHWDDLKPGFIWNDSKGAKTTYSCKVIKVLELPGDVDLMYRRVTFVELNNHHYDKSCPQKRLCFQ